MRRGVMRESRGSDHVGSSVRKKISGEQPRYRQSISPYTGDASACARHTQLAIQRRVYESFAHRNCGGRSSTRGLRADVSLDSYFAVSLDEESAIPEGDPGASASYFRIAAPCRISATPLTVTASFDRPP